MKKFLALSLSDVVFIMLINVKMPTIVELSMEKVNNHMARSEIRKTGFLVIRLICDTAKYSLLTYLAFWCSVDFLHLFQLLFKLLHLLFIDTQLKYIRICCYSKWTVMVLDTLNRIHHWCSVGTEISQPEGPPFQWETRLAEFPTERLTSGLGFFWNHWTPMIDSFSHIPRPYGTVLCIICWWHHWDWCLQSMTHTVQINLKRRINSALNNEQMVISSKWI